MNTELDSVIRVRVAPTNPGQFFACCGLLELADRIWKGAEGWFEKDRFSFFLMRPLRPDTAKISTPIDFLKEIALSLLTNTMTEEQLRRRAHLLPIPQKTIDSIPELQAEKKELDKLWRESPIVLHFPFNLLIDWFLDEKTGGSIFKTWAGQQSVFEIARGMKIPWEADDFQKTMPDEWFAKQIVNDSLPFNFDSDLGGMGSDLDVGFSFDPLKNIKVRSRPLLEFLAFVGLQRFRPVRINAENRFRYFLWSQPLLPEIAAAALCGLFSTTSAEIFEFRLLYRTKYLKSFLPATQIERS